MAQPFFRYQAKARKALRSGQKLKYLPGQGYRIVSDPSYTSSGVVGRKITTPFGEFPAAPAALPDINEADIWGEARTRAGQIANPILEMIAARQQREEERARQSAESRAAQMEAAWQAARAPIQQIYDQHIGQATNLENALSTRLQNVGATQESDLAKKLQLINAPDAAGQAAQSGNLYDAAAAAEFAKGVGNIGALTRSSAADQAWLAKQGPASRAQAMSELAEALSELGSRYGEEREEITANIPGQVNELFESIYGRRSAERESKTEQGRYGYEQNWRRKEYIDARKQQIVENAAARRKELMEKRLVAMEMGDKQAQRRFEAEQKKLERDFEREMAQFELDNTAPPTPKRTGPANQKVITDEYGNVIKNPNYVPPVPGGGNGNDTVATAGSAKRDRARKAAVASVSVGGRFQADVLKKLQRYPNSDNAIINTAINNALRAQGVDPNSQPGRAIRAEIRAKLAGRRWRAKDGHDYEFEG